MVSASQTSSNPRSSSSRSRSKGIRVRDEPQDRALFEVHVEQRPHLLGVRLVDDELRVAAGAETIVSEAERLDRSLIVVGPPTNHSDLCLTVSRRPPAVRH
jgi:hypothetical protein